MTTHHVTTSEELEAAFDAAQDGDRIELAAGDYGAVTLDDRDFAQGLTITSADPQARAVLTEQLQLVSVSGVTLKGIDLVAADLAPEDLNNRVTIDKSSNVTVRDMEIRGHLPDGAEGVDPDARSTRKGDIITGYGYETGMRVLRSEDIDLEEVTFHDLRVAARLETTDHINAIGLEIHDVREGINLTDVRDVEIAESHFHDQKPWKHDAPEVADDHPDMIQYFAQAKSVVGVHGVVIRDNLFDQSGDNLHTQTIYGSMRYAPDDSITASDFTVTGNTIINGHLNAISLYDVTGAEISDNTLLPLPQGNDDPRQVQTPGIVLVRSADVVISGNTLLPFSQNSPIKVDADLLEDGTVVYGTDNALLSTDPDDPLYWRTVLADLPGDGSGSGGGDGEGDGGGNGDGGGGDGDDLLQLFLDAGLPVIEGSDGADKLSGRSAQTVVLGEAGDDVLYARDGNDILAGDDGADRFTVDLRRGGSGADLVVDLDFAEGDDIFLLAGSDLGGGSRKALFSSLDDLAVAAEAGWLRLEDGAYGTVLSTAVAPERGIEIAGVTVAEIDEFVFAPQEAPVAGAELEAEFGTENWLSSKAAAVGHAAQEAPLPVGESAGQVGDPVGTWIDDLPA